MVKSLDDGVMRKPTSAFTGSRTSKSLNFYDIIAKGDNPNGQTTISPAEVTRGGESIGYGQQRWRESADGNRWGNNPMLDAGSDYSWPAIPKKKK